MVVVLVLELRWSVVVLVEWLLVLVVHSMDHRIVVGIRRSNCYFD
jgi:hypothetical protein